MITGSHIMDLVAWMCTAFTSAVGLTAMIVMAWRWCLKDKPKPLIDPDSPRYFGQRGHQPTEADKHGPMPAPPCGGTGESGHRRRPIAARAEEVPGVAMDHSADALAYTSSAFTWLAPNERVERVLVKRDPLVFGPDARNKWMFVVVKI